jgi:hypothetical protein
MGAKDVPSFNVTFSQGMLVVQGRVALELPFRHVNVVWFVTEIAMTVGLVRTRSCVPITTYILTVCLCPPWPAAVAWMERPELLPSFTHSFALFCHWIINYDDTGPGYIAGNVTWTGCFVGMQVQFAVFAHLVYVYALH